MYVLGDWGANDSSSLWDQTKNNLGQSNMSVASGLIDFEFDIAKTVMVSTLTGSTVRSKGGLTLGR